MHRTFSNYLEPRDRRSVTLEPDFIISPNGWPALGDGHIGPGDVEHFVPQGLALAPPPILRPYGSPADASFYGAGSTITHPVKSAPINDDAGGVVDLAMRQPPIGGLRTRGRG